MRLIQVYLSDLKELLETKDLVSLRTALREISPVDLADGWGHFAPQERALLFNLSPRQRALQLFEELDPRFQQELISALRQDELRALVEELDPMETGRLLRRMPKAMVRQLEGILRRGGRQESVERLLQYPAQSVGALMRSRFLRLEPRWTCRQALERVSASTRLRDIEQTFLDQLFVADDRGELLGVVGLKELVVAPGSMAVEDLMDRRPRTLSPETDQEEAAKAFSRYKLKSAPVTDSERRLLGFVWYKDIFEVVRQETEEDFAKMAGYKPGMLSRSVLGITGMRLPWLVATCFGELLVSGIVRGFEDTLSRIVALATFIPLIAAMGGNVGAQTATVMVRGLATGEVAPGGEREAVAKEIGVGVLLGCFYGLAVGLAAHAFYGSRYGWQFSVVVGSAMLVSMTTAATAGSLEPLFFRRLGIDPATATGPLITTFTDILSTVVYFTLATHFLL